MISAIDGKHVRIKCPRNSGTLYHNYKGFFSLVILAICDARYCFTLLDVGQYGSNNDSRVLLKGIMHEGCKDNFEHTLSRDARGLDPLPYFLVGFSLKNVFDATFSSKVK